MSRTAILESDGFARVALGLSGLMLLAAAALSARLALAHMQAIGGICGVSPLAGHCAWCATSAALGLAGLASLGWAARTGRPAAIRR